MRGAALGFALATGALIAGSAMVPLPADAAPPELGELVAGQADGRTGPEQITICDLTGTGAQDTAIATLARARAQAAGAGTLFQS